MVTDNLPFIYVDPCVFILGVNPANQQCSEIIPDYAFKVKNVCMNEYVCARLQRLVPMYAITAVKLLFTFTC